MVIANWSHSSSSDYSGQVPQATGQAVLLTRIPSGLFLLQRFLLGFLETRHWQVRFLHLFGLLKNQSKSSRRQQCWNSVVLSPRLSSKRLGRVVTSIYCGLILVLLVGEDRILWWRQYLGISCSFVCSRNGSESAVVCLKSTLSRWQLKPNIPCSPH